MAVLELSVTTTPGTFEINNFEVLKRDLENVISDYKNLVVCDDEETLNKYKELYENTINEANELGLALENYFEINKTRLEELRAIVKFDGCVPPKMVSTAEAKKIRANLNNASKAFNDKRIAVQKTYMRPFECGKAQVDDLISLVKSVSEELDKSIKALDEKSLEKKKEFIKHEFDLYNKVEWLTLEKIYNSKWENKTTKYDAISVEIQKSINDIMTDLATLEEIASGDNAFLTAMISDYKQSLNVNVAISSGKRFKSELKEVENAQALERKIAEQRAGVDIKEYKVTFVVTANILKIKELGDFLRRNNYLFTQLKESE